MVDQFDKKAINKYIIKHKISSHYVYAEIVEIIGFHPPMCTSGGKPMSAEAIRPLTLINKEGVLRGLAEH